MESLKKLVNTFSQVPLLLIHFQNWNNKKKSINWEMLIYSNSVLCQCDMRFELWRVKLN